MVFHPGYVPVLVVVVSPEHCRETGIVQADEQNIRELRLSHILIPVNFGDAFTPVDDITHEPSLK